MTEQERVGFALYMGRAAGILSKIDKDAAQAVLDAWTMLQEPEIDWGAVDDELQSILNTVTAPDGWNREAAQDRLRALLRKVSGQ